MVTILEQMAEAKRVQLGARVEEHYKMRIQAVARKKKTSPRSILEQLFERALPDLEREAGILHEDPAPYAATPTNKKAK